MRVESKMILSDIEEINRFYIYPSIWTHQIKYVFWLVWL